ncbi:MAG: type II toxin-antitoxin system RelB/DinJ family antitoxin [Spirochaetia bacterium]|jgi:DNA-damage-inducible protein J|nr:type II toxin-antitoxin system RelB/DinJ family antitoxin [Spirochaetia bacterium]
MSKTATIRARVEPELKSSAESIFHKLGMSATEAITLFYSLVKLNNGLPFELKIPNAETEETFKSTDTNKKLNTYKSADDLFSTLDRI